MAEPITLHTGGVYLVDGETVIPEECALEAVESTLEFPDPDVAREGTIAYGILAEHNTSGDMAHLKLRFDALASHDITYVGVIQTAKASGMTEFPVPYVLTNCHNTLCACLLYTSQGGVYQSATYLGRRRFEPVFEYIRAFDAMFEAEDSMRGIVGHGIERVLMLGGGGYSYPKHALATHRLLAMDVVELDASVTLLARRWFYLDELERMAGDRLSLITADARSYMGEALAAGMRYDVVAVSYTHLDVYKRQPRFRRLRAPQRPHR